MKKLYIVLLLITIGCQTTTVNKIPFNLKKLEGRGLIKQSENKEILLSLISPILWETFTNMGYSYAKTEFQNTWSIYEDQKYVIVTGSIGKSKTDYLFFTILILDGQIVYSEIGNESAGEYPKNIIPFTKLDAI